MTAELTSKPTEHLKDIQTCLQIDKSMEVSEWQISTFVWSGIVVATAIFAISLFWPEYRRIEHETKHKENQVFSLHLSNFYTEQID
jgi:hypothetical protein